MPFRPLRTARRLARLPFALLRAVAGVVAAVPGRAAYKLHRFINRAHYDALARGVFRFWSGTRWRTVDPVVAWGVLGERLGGDFGRVFADLSRPAPADATPEQLDALERQRGEDAARLSDAAAAAFGVKVVGSAGATGDDDEWLSRVEMLRLVVLYLRFMGENRHLGERGV